MALELTKRQRSVLMQIARGIQTHGYPPTFREIGAREGIRSTNGVRCILDALERKQYIRRRRYQSRAIELTPLAREIIEQERNNWPHQSAHAVSIELSDTFMPTSRIVQIPILGRVAAGEPLFADQNIESHIAIDADYAPAGETFALRVKGSSMIGAGIHEEDVVFCRIQEHAEPGEMIVALINDEATVKYFHPEKNRIILMPDNPDFAPIIIEDNLEEFRILGKVVGLFRRY